MTTSNPTGIEAIKLKKKQKNLLASHTQSLGYIFSMRGDPKKQQEIRKKNDKLHDTLSQYFSDKKKVFGDQNHQYELNMLSLGQLRNLENGPHHNCDFNIPLHLLGPGVDSFKLPMNPLFSNGVQVVASQTNCNESTTPKSPTPPSLYFNDKTQGPRAQLASPLAAYYRWEALKNNPDACDFLVDFKKKENTIIHDGKVLRFNNIFFEQNGYVYPKNDFEEPAVSFLRTYADKIKINFEKVTTHLPDEKGRVPYFQALTAAFSLSREYSGKSEEQIQRCQTAAQLFLNTQFEIVARATVREAQKNPGTPMPLVLCPVGYGVFENEFDTVAFAINDAIEIIGKSGCDNVHVYLSCFSEKELTAFQQYFQSTSPIKDNLSISRVAALQSHGNQHASGLGQRSRDVTGSQNPSRLSPPDDQVASSSSLCCGLFNWMRGTPKNNINANNENTPLMVPKY